MHRLIPFATLLTATSAFATPDAKDAPPRVLVVPTVAHGEVRQVLEKRVAKAMADVVQFSSKLQAVTDKDRADQGLPAGGKAVKVKGTMASKRIDEADIVRQEATDLAAEGKHGEAYTRFQHAIALYEKAYGELVDFTKLADAFARAGLAAFNSGKGAGEARRLFEQGIVLQPTLVIDRRKQPKDLLAAFDGVHEDFAKAGKWTIAVECAAPGAEVFVDGVRAGPVPSKAESLLPGTHYVQVRGEGWQPWGTIVQLRTDAKVSCKPTAQKQAPKPTEADDLTVADLDLCARQGAFHQDVCKGPGQALGKQAGAQLLVFSALTADKFGRITFWPFVMEAASGATVAGKPIELAPDLSDLNAKAAALEADLVALANPFPRARGLTKTPQAWKAGSK